MAKKGTINWRNLLTVGSISILVGVELLVMTFAAGWALGGIFDLPQMFRIAFEVIGVSLGLLGLYYFVRSALRAEPVRN